jgi:hypothetical protein
MSSDPGPRLLHLCPGLCGSDDGVIHLKQLLLAGRRVNVRVDLTLSMVTAGIALKGNASSPDGVGMPAGGWWPTPVAAGDAFDETRGVTLAELR